MLGRLQHVLLAGLLQLGAQHAHDLWHLWVWAASDLGAGSPGTPICVKGAVGGGSPGAAGPSGAGGEGSLVPLGLRGAPRPADPNSPSLPIRGVPASGALTKEQVGGGPGWRREKGG